MTAIMSTEIDRVVAMGRTVLDCQHGPNTWCACKVRDLARRMVAAGWTPPDSGSTPSGGLS